MLTGIKDLDHIILNKLDDKDLVNVCQTNKKADEICNNQGFWLNRIRTKFPELTMDILNKYKRNRTWSNYYIKDLIQIKPRSARDAVVNGAYAERLDWIIVGLKNGADINTYLGNYPIVIAADIGNLDIVKYLVEHGADIHIAHDVSLRTASEHGYLDIVKYLVEKGANINDVDIYTKPLSSASENGHLDVMKFLVENGADVHARNNEAIRFADTYYGGKNKDEIIDYLVSLGAPRP